MSWRVVRDGLDGELPVTAVAKFSVRGAIAWGTMGSIVLRVGSLAVGIFLARMFAPADFAVFAVALTVSTILTSIADLGLSSGLIRSPDPESDAPTVATISVVVGAVFALGLVTTAPLIEKAFGVSGSAPVVAVLGLSIPLASLGVVPYAALLRRFDQKSLLLAATTDFIVSTVVTVVLVLLGVGPMALAIARVAAQLCGTAVQFARARMLPRFGFDKRKLGPTLSFGIPIAVANVLTWAVISVDNLVVARVVGDVALGFYALAFNISNWPINAVGNAIRSIALPWFSRENELAAACVDGEDRRALARAGVLTWAVALPTGVLITVMASPIIAVLYGSSWADSSGALAALGVFATMRVMFDLFSTYLLARGASKTVLAIQVIWVGALVPASIVGGYYFGIEGVGWSHSAVGLVLILPIYLVVLRRSGANISALATGSIRPLLSFLPAVAAAVLVVRTISHPLPALILGSLVAVAIYGLSLRTWITRVVRDPSAATHHADEYTIAT